MMINGTRAFVGSGESEKQSVFSIRGNPLDPRNPRSIFLQEGTDD
jgi:hypothetical protein